MHSSFACSKVTSLDTNLVGWPNGLLSPHVLRLCGKVDEPNDQFRNFFLPLLGDKDLEKVLEVVTKVEKNNCQKFEAKSRACKESHGSPLYGGSFLLL